MSLLSALLAFVLWTSKQVNVVLGYPGKSVSVSFHSRPGADCALPLNKYGRMVLMPFELEKFISAGKAEQAGK